eukprot:30745-Pelagococcus_subviridis.AAC.10
MRAQRRDRLARVSQIEHVHAVVRAPDRELMRAQRAVLHAAHVRAHVDLEHAAALRRGPDLHEAVVAAARENARVDAAVIHRPRSLVVLLELRHRDAGFDVPHGDDALVVRAREVVRDVLVVRQTRQLALRVERLYRPGSVDVRRGAVAVDAAARLREAEHVHFFRHAPRGEVRVVAIELDGRHDRGRARAEARVPLAVSHLPGDARALVLRVVPYKAKSGWS